MEKIIVAATAARLNLFIAVLRGLVRAKAHLVKRIEVMR